MMPSCGCDFQSTFGALLALYLAHITGVIHLGYFARFGWGQGHLPRVVAHNIAQSACSNNLTGVDPRRLRA